MTNESNKYQSNGRATGEASDLVDYLQAARAMPADQNEADLFARYKAAIRAEQKRDPTRYQSKDATPADQDVWTVIAPDGRKWQDPSIARAALRARFATGDAKEMLDNIKTALSDVPDTEPSQCVHCGHVETRATPADQEPTDEQLIDSADAALYRCLENAAKQKGFTSIIDAIIKASYATSADHSVPVAKVHIHAMWASGGCTGFNDYLMTDYSIRTLKAIDLKRGQVFPPNDGSYETVLPTNPYAKSLTDKLEKATQPPQNPADHIVDANKKVDAYALEMLVAVGHVSRAKVGEALSIAAKIPGVGDAQSVRDAERYREKHPWAAFLESRRKCIDWMRSEGKDSATIARELSIDAEQVERIEQATEGEHSRGQS